MMHTILRSVKVLVAAIGLAMCVGAWSCTENSPPKSQIDTKAVLPEGLQMTQSGGGVVMMGSPNVFSQGTPDSFQTASLPPNLGPTNAAGPNTNVAAPMVAAAPPAPKDEIVVPPMDAKWTIFCTVIGGPGHGVRAAQLKAQLAATTNSNKWYVVHEDDKSTIYYGFYRTIERGTRDGEAAQADKASIAGLRNASGEAPLQLCSFMQIDRPAPTAPAEWDLANAKRNADDDAHYWSLQIAAYTADGTAERPGDVADRKSAAVESVKALRAQGTPAYYYHGDSVSSVCIGVWPANAVKRQNGGDAKGNAHEMNPNKPLLVADALPPNLREIRTPDGQQVAAMTTKIEIIDENMLRTAQQFPRHLLNGYEMKHETKGQVWFESSFLVLVPEPKITTAGGLRQNTPDADLLPLLPPSALGGDPRTPPQPGAGRLREIGQ